MSTAHKTSFLRFIRPRQIGTYGFLLIFALFCLVPLYVVVNTSLKTEHEVYAQVLQLPKIPQFHHYVTVWKDLGFSQYFINTVIISLPVTILTTLLSLLAAYPLAKIRFRGDNVIFLFFLAGIMISPISLVIPLYINLKPLGLINTHLGVICALTALGIPFGVFLLRLHCQYVPQELLDAAEIDGCSSFMAFTKVLFPLVMPGIKATALIEMLWAWNNYLIPLILIQKNSLKPLTVGLDAFTTRFTTHYPYLAAASVITFLPVVLVYLIAQRSFIRGVTTGALK